MSLQFKQNCKQTYATDKNDILVQNIHVRSLIIGYMIQYRVIWLRRLIVSSFKPMIYFTK